MEKKLIWTIPVRLFHWLLFVFVSISLYTGFEGGITEMDYHMLSGYCVLTLILFRVIWGLIAKGSARFSHFLKSPGIIWRYIKGQEPKPIVGHNPLGALSVVAILMALLLQTSTGLFANDDIFLEGPLTHLVSYGTSRQLTAIHKNNMWLICFLVGLHLLAVLYYEIIKKDRLVLTMITGKKQLAAATGTNEQHQLLLGLVLIVICSASTYCLVTYL
ncbi:MAG: cytochrome b/b6 domain-containing protein [bacterium]|nr:cytochrome B [Gammaproteobacteria bacterium]